MNKDEPITEMFTRFTNITNDLKSLSVTYSQTDKVKKILRSLTTDWEKKTTAIEEAQDLSKLTLDDLIGNLMAYEVHMKERREEEQPTKKTLAFPALSENEDSEKESEIALLTRKFQRFMRRNRLPNKHKERKDPKEDSMCYQCNKPGHLRRDCPLLKRKSKTEEPKKRFFKKKALHAQWDDSEPSTSEESSDDEAETANMCFMAESSVSESLDFSFEELQNAFQKLFEESRKTIVKNNHLKSENLELMLKNEKLSIENSELQKKNFLITSEISSTSSKTKNLQLEISELKSKTENLMKTVFKFTKGKENLDKLLSSQKVSFYKNGIGYSHFKPSCVNQKTTFVKGSSEPKNEYYNFNSLKSSKVIDKPKSKWIWVPKSNKKGPEWVPQRIFT